MTIYIHNNSGEEKTYEGVPIADAAVYQIPASALPEYQDNATLATDILAGDIEISLDGSTVFSTAMENLNALLGNNIQSVAIDGVDKSTGLKSIATHQLPIEGTSLVSCTHDYCDKTTWYSDSAQATDETLTTSDDLTYSATNDYWIDATHGKIHNEDTINSDNSYDIVVKVDDVVTTTGFTIDYVAGEVVFDSAQTGSTIKATYKYAQSSIFTFGPADSGKVLHIEHTELQFSVDADVSSNIYFDTYVYNPADLPNKILYKRVKYKSMRDIINESNLGYHVPAIGALNKELVIFPFNYGTAKSLAASTGAEIRITTDNDDELDGTYGVLTMYVLVKDES